MIRPVQAPETSIQVALAATIPLTPSNRREVGEGSKGLRTPFGRLQAREHGAGPGAADAPGAVQRHTLTMGASGELGGSLEWWSSGQPFVHGAVQVER